MKPVGLLSAVVFIAGAVGIALAGHSEFSILLVFLGGACLFAFGKA